MQQPHPLARFTIPCAIMALTLFAVAIVVVVVAVAGLRAYYAGLFGVGVTMLLAVGLGASIARYGSTIEDVDEAEYHELNWPVTEEDTHGQDDTA